MSLLRTSASKDASVTILVAMVLLPGTDWGGFADPPV
jgi:hypothetical protein